MGLLFGPFMLAGLACMLAILYFTARFANIIARRATNSRLLRYALIVAALTLTSLVPAAAILVDTLEEQSFCVRAGVGQQISERAANVKGLRILGEPKEPENYGDQYEFVEWQMGDSLFRHDRFENGVCEYRTACKVDKFQAQFSLSVQKTALTPTRTQYDFVVRNLGSGSIMATQRVINTVPKEHFGGERASPFLRSFLLGLSMPGLLVGYVFLKDAPCTKTGDVPFLDDVLKPAMRSLSRPATTAPS